MCSEKPRSRVRAQLHHTYDSQFRVGNDFELDVYEDNFHRRYVVAAGKGGVPGNALSMSSNVLAYQGVQRLQEALKKAEYWRECRYNNWDMSKELIDWSEKKPELVQPEDA